MLGMVGGDRNLFVWNGDASQKKGWEPLFYRSNSKFSSSTFFTVFPLELWHYGLPDMQQLYPFMDCQITF